MSCLAEIANDYERDQEEMAGRMEVLWEDDRRRFPGPALGEDRETRRLKTYMARTLLRWARVHPDRRDRGRRELVCALKKVLVEGPGASARVYPSLTEAAFLFLRVHYPEVLMILGQTKTGRSYAQALMS